MTATAHEAPRPAYVIESVDSALSLLDMFARQGHIRLSEAAEALGVSPSTAHRLLAMLCYHGYATQDHRRREYRCGPALMRAGLTAMKKLDIRELARPIMEALAAELNETIGLGIRQGAQVLYVAGVDGTRVVRVGARTGALIPAHCISMGKALLSGLDDERLDEIFPHEALPSMTEQSVAKKSELRAQLATVRRRGYAQSVGESEEGVASIAVGIFDQAGTMHAAMSVAAPSFRATRTTVAEWLPPLRNAAARLGAALPIGS